MSGMSLAAKRVLRDIAMVASLPECESLGSVGLAIRGRAKHTAEELKSAGLGRIEEREEIDRSDPQLSGHLFLTSAGRREVIRMIRAGEIKIRD